MAGSSGSLNLNLRKILFDDKNWLSTDNMDGAQFIVLDGLTVIRGRSSQAGAPVHPVRRITAEALKTWLGSGGGGTTVADQYMMRADGVPIGQNRGVRFIFRLDPRAMASKGLTADNVASITAVIAGKKASLSSSFATMTWNFNGSYSDTYFSDVHIPDGFLSPDIADPEAIRVSVSYATDSVTVDVSNLSAEAVWSMYTVFYAVEVVSEPRIRITEPSSGSEVRIGSQVTVSGSATGIEDGAQVTFQCGGTVAGSAVLSGGNFNWEWTVSGTPGSTILKAVCDTAEDSIALNLILAPRILSPQQGSTVPADEPFTVRAGSSDSSVNVFAGSTRIASLSVENGTASGAVTLPEDFWGLSTAFIVENDSETPTSQDPVITLKVTDTFGEDSIDVTVQLDREFGVGQARGTVGFTADRNAEEECTFNVVGAAGFTPESENTSDFGLDAVGEVTATEPL